MIAALGLLIGIVAGLVLQPTVPLWLQPYLPIAVVAALDAVFGGLRALLDGIFDDRVFIVSFLSNVVVAALIVFLGDQLGVGAQLSTGVVVVLGIRIFSNAAAIRRHIFKAVTPCAEPETAAALAGRRAAPDRCAPACGREPRRRSLLAGLLLGLLGVRPGRAGPADPGRTLLRRCGQSDLVRILDDLTAAGRRGSTRRRATLQADQRAAAHRHRPGGGREQAARAAAGGARHPGRHRCRRPARGSCCGSTTRTDAR